MRLVWHGTASIEIQTGDTTFLFDPFVPLKHSPVPVTLKEFDGYRNVFITHGHVDHIASLPQIVKRNPDVRIHCTKTPYKTLLRKGVPEENMVQIAPGKVWHTQGASADQSISIKAFPGKHARLTALSWQRAVYALRSPARGNIPYLLKECAISPEKRESLFYEIEAEGKRVAMMGSLNMRSDVAYPTGADVLILPYNGWSDNYPPAMSVLERLKPQRVLLDHYDDTFPPFTAPVPLRPILEQSRYCVKAMILHKEEVL